MSEACPLRESTPITEEIIARDASIPEKCMGCLALAIATGAPLVTEYRKSTYKSPAAEARAEEYGIDVTNLDRWQTTTFIKPDDRPQRRVIVMAGYELDADDQGFEFNVTDVEKIKFSCSEELGQA